jgi:hypothetical protein
VDTPDNPYTTHTGEAEVEAINRIPLALRSFETPQDRSFETPQDRPASAGLSADFETARKNRASSG